MFPVTVERPDVSAEIAAASGGDGRLDNKRRLLFALFSSSTL